MTTYADLDLSARYHVAGWPACAVYIAGPVMREVELETREPCDFPGDDDDCPDCGGTGHHYFYELELEPDPQRATVVMVGDDHPETVDVDDLEELAGPVCECGQIGCPWHGMEE
jgi:hypothetical protein